MIWNETVEWQSKTREQRKYEWKHENHKNFPGQDVSVFCSILFCEGKKTLKKKAHSEGQTLNVQHIVNVNNAFSHAVLV